GSDLPATVKVRELGNPKAVEGRRQVGDGNGALIQLQPGGFDPVAVTDARPVAADPAGPAAPPPICPRLKPQPSDHVVEHFVSRSLRPLGRAGRGKANASTGAPPRAPCSILRVVVILVFFVLVVLILEVFVLEFVFEVSFVFQVLVLEVVVLEVVVFKVVV